VEARRRADAYLAAWLISGIVATKNEGLLALLASVGVVTWYGWRRRDTGAARSVAIPPAWDVRRICPGFAIKQSFGLVTDIFDSSRISGQPSSASDPLWRACYATWHGFLSQIGDVVARSDLQGQPSLAWGLAAS